MGVFASESYRSVGNQVIDVEKGKKVVSTHASAAEAETEANRLNAIARRDEADYWRSMADDDSMG